MTNDPSERGGVPCSEAAGVRVTRRSQVEFLTYSEVLLFYCGYILAIQIM